MTCSTTNIGAQFFISTEPVTSELDEAGYWLLEYVQVPNVGNMGDTGVTQNLVSYPTWDRQVLCKGKGQADAGDPTVEFGDALSSGLSLMIAAAAPDNPDMYAFKIVWADDSVEFNQGLVTGPQYLKGSNEDFKRVLFSLGLQYAPVRSGVNYVIPPIDPIDRGPMELKFTEVGATEIQWAFPLAAPDFNAELFIRYTGGAAFDPLVTHGEDVLESYVSWRNDAQGIMVVMLQGRNFVVENALLTITCEEGTMGPVAAYANEVYGAERDADAWRQAGPAPNSYATITFGIDNDEEGIIIGGACSPMFTTSTANVLPDGEAELMAVTALCAGTDLEQDTSPDQWSLGAGWTVATNGESFVHTGALSGINLTLVEPIAFGFIVEVTIGTNSYVRLMAEFAHREFRGPFAGVICNYMGIVSNMPKILASGDVTIKVRLVTNVVTLSYLTFRSDESYLGKTFHLQQSGFANNIAAARQVICPPQPQIPLFRMNLQEGNTLTIADMRSIPRIFRTDASFTFVFEDDEEAVMTYIAGGWELTSGELPAVTGVATVSQLGNEWPCRFIGAEI